MKLFLACSKYFYNRIPEIKKELESYGHIISLPNSYDVPMMEEQTKKEGQKAHAEWKGKMLKKCEENIAPTDAVVVLNFEKNGQVNYIGGATFLEMHIAFLMNKKIFLYDPIPDNMFRDELEGFDPIVINGNLRLIK